MSVVTLGVAGTFLVAQDQPSGGAVEGTVINSATGAGVDGASVVFSNQSDHYDSRADAVGHFKITGMTPGNYRANAGKEGFAPLLDDLAPSLSSQGYRVVSSPDPVRVELKLTPLGTLSGRVFGPDGKPAAGVEVRASFSITGGMSVTDAEGRFALENLRPGSYTLIARPPKDAEPVQAKDGTRTAIVTTYYPSEADQSHAQQIAFSGQGDFYDIRMHTAPVHRVRGIVLDEEGKPSPAAELTLLQNPEDTRGAGQAQLGGAGPVFLTMGFRIAAREATVTAGRDGRFEFPAVPSGDWRIDAVSGRSLDPEAPRGTAPAVVASDDVEDLQIRVAAPFKLVGTVEWKSDDPGTQRSTFPPLTLVKADSTELRQSGFAGPGAWSFDYISAGRYKAIMQPGFAAQIFLGDYEVTGQTFALAADGPRLRVVLKTWSGTVRGTVEKGEGAMVLLIPQRNDDVYIGQMIRCGADGTLELSKVSPGDYYIAAFDRVDGVLPSAAILDLMPSRGTSVRVEEGSTADVMLSLVLAPK
ncbi:MAG TPA: carboxypeptidase-like regulatory domain-containing protein [Bryobacteraceae bacterium]